MLVSRLRYLLIACLMFSLLAAACGLVNPPATPASATPDSRTPQALTAQAGTQIAAEAQATLEAAATVAENTAQTEAAQATADFAVGATQTRLAEITTNRNATRQAVTVRATERALDFFEVVQELERDGVLSSTAGAYEEVGDFEGSLARLNYYVMYPTGRSPADFVVRADAFWESASSTADWWASGCGFVFREDGFEDQYMIFLGLDGVVNLQRILGGNYAILGSATYGRLEVPSGGAQIMLAVQGSSITFFVNGEKVKTWRDNSIFSGGLNFTLVSGTNKDFGTRCRMENVELWELD